jgi:hemin uptake protein HemP
MNDPRPELPAEPAPSPAPASLEPLRLVPGPSSAERAGELPRADSGRQDSAVRQAEQERAHNPLPKIIPFDGLARCGDEVWIENAGQIYRLRRTRQGKLILTK